MAYVQRNRLDRFRRHAIKKLRCTVKGLGPEKLLGRVTAPPVLINSIPKSGTHLIEGILEAAPPYRNAGQRTIVSASPGCDARCTRRLRRLRRGAIYNAHLPYWLEYSEALTSSNAKCLFVLRDPKDVAVSRMRYVTEIDLTHPATVPMQNLGNDSERVRAAIIGIPGAMPPLAAVYRSFLAWAERSGVLMIRFEDLVCSSDEEIRSEVTRILAFCGCMPSASVLETATRRIGGKSSTFRTGKSGGWVYEFDGETREVFSHEFHGLKDLFGQHRLDDYLV